MLSIGEGGKLNMANIVKLNYTAEEINQRLGKVGEIENTYVTKDELEEVADSIRRWSAGIHYETGDTVLIKYGNVDRMFRCIVEHTSDEDGDGKISQNELDTNWEEIFQAARAAADENGVNIHSNYLKQTTASNVFLQKTDAANTYATKDLLMNCNIIKLNKKAAETDANNYFDIDPNMLIMATAGDNKCINYTVATGTKIEGTNEYERENRTTGANMILALSVKSNEQVEGTTNNLNVMHRVSCMSYSTTSFMTVEIPKVEVKNNFVSKPRIENSSTTADVYVYYIKQG
jgi:hypothetical protein